MSYPDFFRKRIICLMKSLAGRDKIRIGVCYKTDWLVLHLWSSLILSFSNASPFGKISWLFVSFLSFKNSSNLILAFSPSFLASYNMFASPWFGIPEWWPTLKGRENVHQHEMPRWYTDWLMSLRIHFPWIDNLLKKDWASNRYPDSPMEGHPHFNQISIEKAHFAQSMPR